MANLNKVFLIGRLTRDPETRYAPSGTAITLFGLAANRTFKGKDGKRQEEVTYVDITTFGATAKFVSEYLTKGRVVHIEGRLNFSEWTTKEGQKRSKLAVIADNVQALDFTKKEGTPTPEAGSSEAPF